MTKNERPISFWTFVVFLALSIVLMLLGQTMSVFNYDFTVRYGLQESPQLVGEFGMQVNRAFGVSDTVVYIPLLIISLIGLLQKKRWALLTTAAVSGISAYWSATVGFMFLFLPETPGYNNVPEPEVWLFIGVYFIFGVWGLFCLIFRGEKLLR